MPTHSYLIAAAVGALIGIAASQTTIGGLSGSHTDLPRWCGKPYQSGSPNYEPGGMLEPPTPLPTPMLYVRVEPRHTIYDSSEESAEFVVDASISYLHGQPFTNLTPSDSGPAINTPFTTLSFDIRLEDTDELLVTNSVAVNTTENLFEFSLSDLVPRLKPYSIVLYGAPTLSFANQSFTATTELYYLPAKYNGSTVKVDNLDGGLLVANNITDYAFQPLLSFGFYTSCSGFLTSLANVTAYKNMGFTAINPVCSLTDTDTPTQLFDWLDAANLWYQYDMRNVFNNGLNTTQLEQNIPAIKDRSNLLTWYTADEPDGWQYALNQTRIAYDILKQADPYHPTALVLNCDNYYFDQYSSGADYIMEDAYPIGINATYSKWNTTCNETYGDCGCDDCMGELKDVSNRLDAFFDYQLWLGEFEKPLWAVLQAFSGEGYWSRDPTQEETWAMVVLSFNHGAKGIMSWTFPASETLEKAHGAIAKVAAALPVASFLVGAQPTRISVPGHELLDVAYWVVGDQVLFGVANLDYVSQNDTISIELPIGVSGLIGQPWGSVTWSVGNDHLTARGLDGLATSFVILCM